MTTSAEKAKAEEPAASPSSPSVRLTALAAPISATTPNTPHATPPTWRLAELRRTNEMSVGTLAQVSARITNPTATTSWPRILARLLSPRLRCCLTLIQSSMSPTIPAPTMAKTTVRPGVVKTAVIFRWPCEAVRRWPAA